MYTKSSKQSICSKQQYGMNCKRIIQALSLFTNKSDVVLRLTASMRVVSCVFLNLRNENEQTMMNTRLSKAHNSFNSQCWLPFSVSSLTMGLDNSNCSLLWSSAFETSSSAGRVLVIERRFSLLEP